MLRSLYIAWETELKPRPQTFVKYSESLNQCKSAGLMLFSTEVKNAAQSRQIFFIAHQHSIYCTNPVFVHAYTKGSLCPRAHLHVNISICTCYIVTSFENLALEAVGFLVYLFPHSLYVTETKMCPQLHILLWSTPSVPLIDFNGVDWVQIGK